MEIKTYGLTDIEVANAVEMFAKEEWDKYGYSLMATESIYEDGKTLAEFIAEMGGVGDDDVKDYVEFAESFDLDEWVVYAMYEDTDGKNEFCGFIAFKDWNG